MQDRSPVVAFPSQTWTRIEKHDELEEMREMNDVSVVHRMSFIEEAVKVSGFSRQVFKWECN